MSPARRRRSRCLLALAAAATLALVTAGACGGGGSSTPEHTPFQPSVQTVPTIGDPSSLQLTPVTSVTNTFTIDIPPDWTSQGVGNTQEETWQLQNGTLLAAEIGVTCEPVPAKPSGEAWTADDFVARDRGFRNFSGPVQTDEGGTFALTVAGVPAVGTSYTVTVSGIPIRQQAIYLVKGSCAWILRMRVYGNGDAANYASLFGRVVGSFKPT